MPKAAQPPSSDPEEHAQRDHVVPFPRSPQQQQEQRSSHNLPLELSSFVGREREIADVKRLLLVEEDNNRLLTLTGPEGCGKIRLALAVASEVVEAFVEDGVWLVELASPSDPDLVPQAVASTLAVREHTGRSLTATLVDALRPRYMLLVLDNCEHLIEACAALSEALLLACPYLRILATGRQDLGIGGERDWLVPSLSLPDSQDLPAPSPSS
jgi:predicted ATPase